MYRSFLLITFRILWREKVTSFVNIFSLSIGMSAFIFIFLYVSFQLNYDKFNVHYDTIYRLEADEFGKLNPLAAAHLYGKIPEIKNIVRLSGEFKSELVYSSEKNPEHSRQVNATYFWADSTVFDMFTFPFVEGDPNKALKEPMTVVITESLAKKLFDDEHPLLKTIDVNGIQFMVTGVMKDVRYSHLAFDALFSMESTQTVFSNYTLEYMNRIQNYGGLWSATYVQLTEFADVRAVENKISSLMSELNDGALSTIPFEEFRIRPLKDMYLKGEMQKLSYGVHGNFKMVNLLIAVGIFLLVLGVINYVNLTTARSTSRAKEVALKRLSGSSANQLRLQLIIESLIVSMISLVVALTIVQLFFSKFSEIALTGISINQLTQPVSWLWLIGGSALVGLVAGIYPAFYMTDIQPVRLIKGEGISGSSGYFFRGLLMTFQFTMSIILLVAIITNLRQLDFIRTADLGFNKEQVITVATPNLRNQGEKTLELRRTFKERLLQLPEIKKVAYSVGVPGAEVMNIPPMTIDGVTKPIRGFMIDLDFIDALELEILQGRGFSPDFPADQTDWTDNKKVGNVVINETMARDFGLDNPIGKTVYYEPQGFQWKIIGVVKDFHFSSLHQQIEPMSMVCVGYPNQMANIKIKSSSIPKTLEGIEAVWRSVYNQNPFDYEFMDDSYDKQYRSDEQFVEVIRFFTGLAVLIACLGLFALSSFMVSRRTKEIGIRKTMGASVVAIYSMLSWNFLKWIFLAIGIACPIGWYLMNMWLSTFAYHISLGIDIFILAASLAIAIALITITGQSLKAANANPIKSLRYE